MVSGVWKALALSVTLALVASAPASAGYLHQKRAIAVVTHENAAYVRQGLQGGFEILDVRRDSGHSVWVHLAVYDVEGETADEHYPVVTWMEHVSLHQQVISARLAGYAYVYRERL